MNKYVIIGLVSLAGLRQLQAFDLPPATGSISAQAEDQNSSLPSLNSALINNYGGEIEALAWPGVPYVPLTPNYIDARGGVIATDDPDFSPALTVAAHVEMGGDPQLELSGSALALVSYSVELLGPAGQNGSTPTPVPVDYSLAGATGIFQNQNSEIESGQVYASISTGMAGFANSTTGSLTLTTTKNGDSQAVDITNGIVYMVPNEVYTVSLVASVGLVGAPRDGSTFFPAVDFFLGESLNPEIAGYATMDPYFKVDSSVAGEGYAIAISPNVDPVPEPSGLFAVGLISLGGWMLKVRRK